MMFSNIIYEKVIEGGPVRLDGVELAGYLSFEIRGIVSFNRIPVVAMLGKRPILGFFVPSAEAFPEEKPQYEFALSPDYTRVLQILQDYVLLKKQSPYLTVRTYVVEQYSPELAPCFRPTSNDKWGH